MTQGSYVPLIVGRSTKGWRRIGSMLRREKLLIASLSISSSIVILNMLYIDSFVLGCLSSTIFFVSIGLICGKLLYNEDPLTLKVVKGFFTILVILTLIGTTALYLDLFNEFVSAVIVAVVAIVFLVYFLLRSPSLLLSAKSTRTEGAQGIKRNSQIVVVALFGFTILLSFLVLLSSRTGEPMFSVWHTIPRMFVPLVFLSTLLLVSFISFKRNSSVHLVLVVVQFFLFVSLYYIVWYPSTAGDPLDQLGAARLLARTGSIHGKSYLISTSQWLNLLRYQGFLVLDVLLARMISFDIYWVHNISFPLLWAVILPLSAYETTCYLVNKSTREFPRESVLAAFSAAFLVSSLIIWGAVQTPNTLGFLLLFFSLPILFHWLVAGGRRLFGIVVMISVATFFVHPMPGILLVVFLFAAVVLREVKATLAKVAILVSLLPLYPLSFLLGSRSLFLPLNLFSVEAVFEFEKTIVTIPFIIALIGFFFFIRRRSSNPLAGTLSTSLLIIIFLEYFITKSSMEGLPLGAGRILTISDFLLVPFIGICFNSLLEMMANQRFGQMCIVENRSRMKVFVNQRLFLAVALCMLVSLQSGVTLYYAYPHEGLGIGPAEYEIEAIYYINSTAPTRFTVISDTYFANLAGGLLGEDYLYGRFGLSAWTYRLQQLYLKMVRQPSLDVFKEALDFAGADAAYFVLPIRESNFEDVLERTSEILPVERVFGDEKLYVFKYPPPIFEGLGPKISVMYDNETLIEEVESKFAYMSKSDVNYAVVLSGHTTYNVTNFPRHWAFQSLTINGSPSTLDASSDVNAYIVESGLNQEDIVELKWSANDFYTDCGWKEDSFRSGWEPYKYAFPIEPTILRDGNILSMSWDFTLDGPQDYYYAKHVSISTNDYRYIMIKWRSTGPIAIAHVFYESGGQTIVPLGSESRQWIVTIAQLQPGMTITDVMVGISNLRRMDISGLQSLYVDYIMICNKATL